MRRIEFQAPRLQHFESKLARYKEAIEFIVQTDAPLPIRAYGPALFIGNIEINNSEVTGETTLRFLHFEPEGLKSGARISWGWMKDRPKDRLRTGFRYELEGDASNPARLLAR
jgi:hypothetical protein